MFHFTLQRESGASPGMAADHLARVGTVGVLTAGLVGLLILVL
jgi:hypothetical protein